MSLAALDNLVRVGQLNADLRSTALANLLDTSPKNVERWLKALRDTDQIEFIGAPKSGGYRVKAAKTK